jgi:hypothetical protein
MLVLGLNVGAGAAETSGDNQSSPGKSKQDDGKGLTVEDLARGLKSAAHNIEQEIPKIGPAIGNTFKNLTGKGSGKSESQSSSKDKK